MARITHVKKARQRYAMVSVRNEDGTPKRTPIMRRVKDWKTGEVTEVPRTDKRGREVTMAVTVQDRSQPLPNLRCDFPGCDIDGGEILPGTPYKHITPRSGPYGGTQRSRHTAHPNWNVWEYSSSRAAQVARVQADMHAAIDSWEPGDESDFESLKDELEGMAQEALDEAQEALDNMPEQLQDGSQAQMNVEALESWVESFSDAPDPQSEPREEQECSTCAGSGKVDCEHCDGSGLDDPDDPECDDDCAECGGSREQDCADCDGEGTTTDDEGPLSEDWIEEAREALRDAVEGCEI